MSYLTALEDADIFYGLSREQLSKIAAICTEIVLKKDRVLFKENSPGDELYVVAHGTVEIRVDPAILGPETNTEPKTVALLRRGQTFGEVALVDQGLRSASARIGEEDTHLLAIGRSDLIALCEQDYHLGYLIMRNIATDMAFKIRNADLVVREQLLWRPGDSEVAP